MRECVDIVLKLVMIDDFVGQEGAEPVPVLQVAVVLSELWQDGLLNKTSKYPY